MMKIDQIWEELETSETTQSSLICKRFSGEVLPNIYVALKAPERLRCIAVQLSNPFDIGSWNKFRDIKIEVIDDEKDAQKQFLLILLLNSQLKDIFSALCEDLIYQVTEIDREDILIQALILRLEKWQLLFEKLNPQGLSAKAQRGLYGELYFLRKFLLNTTDPNFCIDIWQGTENAVHDFQYANWAVEVKTTHGKNHQKIHISNERQLDTAFVSNIFLYHISLNIRQGHGETLNDIVNQVRELLYEAPQAQTAFRLKLFEVGYFDHHREKYENTGYTSRQENIYQVTDNFPKITEDMIPLGVGDVQYSIIISANDSWLLSEEELLNRIINN